MPLLEDKVNKKIGSGQGRSTALGVSIIIGIIIILILIFFYSKSTSKIKIRNLDKLSLSIICNFNAKEKEIENLKNLLLKKSNFIKLISLVKSDNNTTLNFQIPHGQRARATTTNKALRAPDTRDARE
jgi:uncharacterized membrane protein YhiD involved in acid resistance